jgi:hypothetical protein
MTTRVQVSEQELVSIIEERYSAPVTFVNINIMWSHTQLEIFFQGYKSHLVHFKVIIRNIRLEACVAVSNTYCTASCWTWAAGKYDRPRQPRYRADPSHSRCLFGTAHPASARMRTSRIPLLQQQKSKSRSPEQFYTAY